MSLQEQLENLVGDVIFCVTDDVDKVNKYLSPAVSFLYKHKHISQIRNLLLNEFPVMFPEKDRVFRTLVEKKHEGDDEVDKVIESVVKKFLPTIGGYMEDQSMIHDPVGYYEKLGHADEDGGFQRKSDLALNLDKIGFVIDK